MAICPNCNVSNSPKITVCDVCKTALGAQLTDVDAKTSAKWMWTAALVTVGLYIPCRLLELSSITLLVPMFYGPLLASYQAKGNVVWRAAIGGVIGIVAIGLFEIALHWSASRGLFASMAGGHDSVALALVFGVPVATISVLPLSLTGASVGEHLSFRRRHKSSAVQDT